MTKEQSEKVGIIGVAISMFQRVEAVEIELNERGLTVIGGDNAQGKSSVFDAMHVALTGKKYLSERPIKDGGDKAEVEVTTTTGLKIKRAYRESKKDGSINEVVSIETSEGYKVPKMQSVLDELFAGIGFDPVGFIDVKTPQDERDQMAKLMEALKLDFSKLDADRDKAFSQRADVNKEVKRLEGVFESSNKHDDAPGVEVSISDLTTEFEEARKEIDEISSRKSHLKSLYGSLEDEESEIKELSERLKSLERQKSATEAEIHDYQIALKDVEVPDIDAIRERMSTIEADNQKVRDNKEYDRIEKEIVEQLSISEKWTTGIKRIDGKKRAMIEAAKIPIDGLDFGETGLLYQNLPLKQASEAEKIEVAIALAYVLSPNCKLVMIRNGALLDTKMLKKVAGLATEKGLQVLVERVGNGNEVDVLIDNGLVNNSLIGVDND